MSFLNFGKFPLSPAFMVFVVQNVTVTSLLRRKVTLRSVLLLRQYSVYNIGNTRLFCTRNRNFWEVKTPKCFGTYSIAVKELSNSEDLQEFNRTFEIVHSDLICEEKKALTDAVDWCSKVFYYNLKGGKKNRGLTLVKAYKILSENKVSANDLSSACVLGWCIEMLQAFFLMCDDIMDQSMMRRGEPCWYQKPEVGLCAINDSLLLQSGIYKILHKYFGKSDVYYHILHEFLGITHKTVYGQCLDMLCSPPNQKPRFENFTLERYHAIVEHKTSYYTFCLPVHLAMFLAGYPVREHLKSTELICLKLGLLFQIQDDYLDCFGDPKVTGKVGSDIKQGKCTWFAVSLLGNAPKSVQNEMMENYGINNTESVSKVIKLYKDFSLDEKFMMYEEKLYSEIMELISQLLVDKSLQELFHHLLMKTHKRQK